MKKLKKTLAIISAAIMTATMTVTSVSAEISSEKCYDTTYTNSNGYIYPKRVVESLNYSGIVVTMPDENAPDVEEFGINCEIEEYKAINYGYAEIISMDDFGWNFAETVEPADNQYVLNTTSIMSEDEAIDFAEKLMIRGLVDRAEVLYEHRISNGEIGLDALHNLRFYIYLKDDIEDSFLENFSFENYPEIAENIGGTEYTFEKSENSIEISFLINESTYIGSENEITAVMRFYNDVMALNEVMTQKYEEIEKVDPFFRYLYDDELTNAIYSIQPTWGDATNDDVVDLYDAIEISKHLIKANNLDEDTILLADINRDGKTDLYDVIDIAKTLMS